MLEKKLNIYAAAFEKVWHDGLMEKLKQNGISDSCFDLFKSYLTNRKQIVVVDGVNPKRNRYKQVFSKVPDLDPCSSLYI